MLLKEEYPGMEEAAAKFKAEMDKRYNRTPEPTPSKTTTSTSNGGAVAAGVLLGLVGLFGVYTAVTEMQYNDEYVGYICNKDDIC